jgi:Protein of unknown function (DUF2795)
MTKSKKKSSGKQNEMQGQNQNQMQMQNSGTAQEFGRTVELTFGDHPWPASRTELLEHASRQRAFAKSDLARLKRIPHRDYHSVSDLMQATREVEMATPQGPGQVRSAEQNRRAMGRDSADAHVSSAAHFEEPIH